MDLTHDPITGRVADANRELVGYVVPTARGWRVLHPHHRKVIDNVPNAGDGIDVLTTGVRRNGTRWN